MNTLAVSEWLTSRFPDESWEISIGNRRLTMVAVDTDRHGEITTVTISYDGVGGFVSAGIQFGEGDRPVPLVSISFSEYQNSLHALEEFAHQVRLEAADMLATSQWISAIFD
jgi:hypothetical protein